MTLQAKPFGIRKMYFTTDKYHKLIEAGVVNRDERVELIHGEIIFMSPIYSPHGSHVTRVIRVLFENFPKRAYSVIGQNPITLSDKNSEPQPDVIVAKYRADDYYEQHPVPSDIYLLVEVSHSTLKQDRKIKAPLYAQAGIPVYWIINVEESQIEIYEKPLNGQYRSIRILKKDDPTEIEFLGIRLSADELLI